MSDIQQLLLDQATELVQTLTSALSSGGDLSSDIESKIDERVDEVIDEKMDDAISSSDLIPNDDQIRDTASEAASEAIYDTDWYSIMCDHDIASRDYVEERVDERFDELIDDKLFTFMQDIMMKVFEDENNRWIERIKQAGVNEHLELKKKEEEEATEQVKCHEVAAQV